MEKEKRARIIIFTIGTILTIAGVTFFCWAIKAAEISVVIGGGCFISTL